MSKKICTGCGNQLNENDTFCAFCGSTKFTVTESDDKSFDKAAKAKTDDFIKTDNSTPIVSGFQLTSKSNSSDSKVKTKTKVNIKKPSYLFEIILFVVAFILLVVSVITFASKKGNIVSGNNLSCITWSCVTDTGTT